MTEPSKVTRSRFEIEEEGKTGFLDFEVDDQGWMTLWHTEVPEELRGRGLGLQLVTAAFDYAKEHSLRVDVLCPYAQKVVATHPEFEALVGRR
ncbi:MAG TPA: GNAT family N-acetyltransferase [Acidobacteriaceae bacterium]|nr:GNAT family N-acetyltransferase [Acidobacteriaceae bacterium]